MQRIYVYKETLEDDLLPYQRCQYHDYSRSTNLLKVGLIELGSPSNKKWRVNVWGEDDLGMDKDFEHDDYESAKELFWHLISLPNISTKHLEELGFVNF